MCSSGRIFVSGSSQFKMAVHTNSKGALELLSGYGSSDSSEEDSVPGVKVSVKRTLPKDWNDSKGKKKGDQNSKLPLPSVLESLYCKSEEKVTDDPSRHEGRVRSFPHERGNWVTFIYIPYESNPLLKTLLEVFTKLLESVVELKPVEDLHISLTQTFILRHHWIDSFIETVSTNVKELSRFCMTFGSLNVYCNEDRTRTFIGLTVDDGADFLRKGVAVLDKCLSEFKLPPFYKDPSFHMSIGWCLGDQKEKMSEYIPQIDLVFQQLRLSFPEKWNKEVKCFICKTGNKYFSFQLH